MPVHSRIARNFRENTQDLWARAHVCTAGRIHRLTRARARSGAPPSSNPASGAERRALPHPASRVAARTPPCVASASGSTLHGLRAQFRVHAAFFLSRGRPGDGGARSARRRRRPAAGSGRERPLEGVSGRYFRGRGSLGRAGGEGGAGARPERGGCRGVPAGLQLGFHCRVAPMLRFPTCFPSFRVVGEKQLPQEIIFLVWSPKRDLIALANTVGEVSEPAWSPKNTEPGRQRARHAAPASVSPSVHLAGHLSTPPLPSCPAVNFK